LITGCIRIIWHGQGYTGTVTEAPLIQGGSAASAGLHSMRPRVNVSRLLACPPSLGWCHDNLNAIHRNGPIVTVVYWSHGVGYVRYTMVSCTAARLVPRQQSLVQGSAACSSLGESEAALQHDGVPYKTLQHAAVPCEATRRRCHVLSQARRRCHVCRSPRQSATAVAGCWTLRVSHSKRVSVGLDEARL
jgi:hypothetical protein